MYGEAGQAYLKTLSLLRWALRCCCCSAGCTLLMGGGAEEPFANVQAH